MTTPSSSNSTPNTRYIIYKVYGIANKAQAISGISFSTFAAIHGLQIASTLVGGASAMDSSLLLGRPFYQDKYLEVVLVNGSIALHLVAGFTKAVIQNFYFNKNSATIKQDNNNNNNGVLPYHNITGQLFIPLLVGHYVLARDLPKKIMGDSAFIDVGIISWGLQNKKWFTWTLHLALIGTGVYHTISGFSLACKRTFKSKHTNHIEVSSSESSESLKENNNNNNDQQSIVKKKKKDQKLNILIVGISTVLVTGLVIVSRVDKIPLRREYQDIYTRLLSFKL
ncbi:unnamed protein product [Cunninghamella blakesleeana]